LTHFSQLEGQILDPFLPARESNSDPRTVLVKREEIMDKLKVHIGKQFPEGQLNDFKVFNPRSFPLNEGGFATFGLEEINRFSVRF
jgi:hypothetical protein